MFETFLDDIACELVVTQLDDFSFDTLYYFIFVFLTLSMLKNVLDNVVSKLVFCQRMDLS